MSICVNRVYVCICTHTDTTRVHTHTHTRIHMHARAHIHTKTHTHTHTHTRTGAADGEIVGWLPLEVADFVSEFFKKPAALWHMVYDNQAVGEVGVSLLFRLRMCCVCMRSFLELQCIVVCLCRRWTNKPRSTNKICSIFLQAFSENFRPQIHLQNVFGLGVVCVCVATHKHTQYIHITQSHLW